jgi:hypothetical protein
MQQATVTPHRASGPRRMHRAQRASTQQASVLVRKEKPAAASPNFLQHASHASTYTPVSETLAETAKSLRELLVVAKTLVAPQPLTTGQKIAAAVHKWALPVVQVLLGAAILVVGITSMDIPIIVIGATTCATGLAISVTLLAGALAPHPIDRVKELLQRKQSRDPEPYEPGMLVSLDGGG